MAERFEKRLELVGFTPREAEVYVALLEHGPCQVGVIMRATHLYRVIIYEVLRKLVQKGFVSYFLKNGRRQFRAEDPAKIGEAAKAMEAEAKALVSDLQAVKPAPFPDKQALVYEKISGIKAAQENYLRMMEKGGKDEYLMFGASLQLHEKLDNFFNYFHESRSRLGVRARLLFNEDNRAYGDLKKRYVPVAVRYMPKNVITPSWISIYRDMMLIGVIDEEPFAFFIKNKGVVDSYRKYFEMLWKLGTP